MSDDLKNIVEAVLLAAESPLTVSRIQSLFGKSARPEAAEVRACIEQLQADCENRGVELKKISGGYRYQTREKYADYLRNLHAVKPPRLSRALLETLSIIAYRQPVTRGDIEEVRGVTVSPEIMQRLIEREWVKQVGVRDVPGRPALFGTTAEFLSYFNLESLKDLPALMEQRDLGEIAGEMETPLPAEVLAALESKDEESGAEDRDENTGTEASASQDGDFAGLGSETSTDAGTGDHAGAQDEETANAPDSAGVDGESVVESMPIDDETDEDEEEAPSSKRSGDGVEEPRHDGAAPVQELAASAQPEGRG